MAFQKAQRKQVKLKLWLFWPSWSGKTMSALKLAHGLCGDRSKIALLDTENWSASLYSNLWAFDTDVLVPPFSPERYIEKMREAVAAGYEVLVIDSISHEWNGKWGILEMKEAMAGNEFAKRAKLTPIHNSFRETILQLPIHVIVTGRTKEEYAMIVGSDWRTKVEKAGTNIIQRDGVEYELTLAFTIDIKHQASSSKDRTGLFMDKPWFIIDEKTGQALKKWTEEWVQEVIGKWFEELVAQFNLQPVVDICKIIRDDKANASTYIQKIQDSVKIDPIQKDNIFKFINALIW